MKKAYNQFNKNKMTWQNDFIRGQSGLVEKLRSDLASSQSASQYQVSKFPVVTERSKGTLYGDERNLQSGSQKGQISVWPETPPAFPSLLSISTLRISLCCISLPGFLPSVLLLILHRPTIPAHLHLHLSRFYCCLIHCFASAPSFSSFLALSAYLPSSTFVFYVSTGVLTVYFDLDLREISRNSLGAGSSLGKIPFCTQRLLSSS